MGAMGAGAAVRPAACDPHAAGGPAARRVPGWAVRAAGTWGRGAGPAGTRPRGGVRGRKAGGAVAAADGGAAPSGGAQGTAQWHDARMGKENPTMEECLQWRFWNLWGGTSRCRQVLNRAPQSAVGGPHYVFRCPDLMDKRLLALARLLCPLGEAQMDLPTMDALARMPIAYPELLAMETNQLAIRLIELRLAANVGEDVASTVLRNPTLLLQAHVHEEEDAAPGGHP